MAKTKICYECDDCGKLILNVTDGVIIQGNIYVADPDNVGGIIGNNFPQDRATFGIDDVRINAYHISCLTKKLDFKDPEDKLPKIIEDLYGGEH